MRVIRITSENDKFTERVEDLSGQPISLCFQCGECSSSCPVASEMDLLPSTLVRLIQLGQREELLGSKTIWLCSSCFMCFARCPREIDIARVAEALRQLVLREKDVDWVHPNKISREERERLPQIAIVSALRKFST